ncbi:MAG: DinB family protein [Candidatus Thorarchaeota archaeon]
MNSELKSKIDSWKLIRNLTYDLLESLPETDLNKTVSKNMGSFGKQFRHMGDVQLCYNEAIKNRKIDFSKYRRDYSIENSKLKLKQFLEEMDQKLSSYIEKNINAEIDWGFAKVSLIEHLNLLIQHEILHHGELIVYIRSLGLKFPKSWEDIWGPLNLS